MNDLPDRLYERVLVLRCQAGDEAAFAELVERYQARLRYYLRNLLVISEQLRELRQALQAAERS